MIEKALSVAGLSLVLSFPVFARPPGAEPPPQVMRPDLQIRASTDGRGDLHEASVSRPEPQAAVRATPEVMGRHDFQVPIRNEVSMRARPGDEGDNVAKATVKPSTQSQPSTARNDRMGRADAPPPIPMKTQITLRLVGDESPEATKVSASMPSAAQKDAKGQKQQRPHSRQELKDFAKHTGISLPFDPEGSDNADDKTE